MEDIALYFEKVIFPRGKSELGKEDRYYKEICFDHGRQEIREYYTEKISGGLRRAIRNGRDWQE